MNKYRQGQDCKDATASKRKAREEVAKKVEIKPTVMGLTPSQQEKIDIQNHNRKGCTVVYTQL